MASLRPFRAALLSLVLGLLCLGPSLVPGRALLPADPRGWEPYPADLSATEAAEVARVNERAVPHRADRLLQFLPFDTAVGRSWARGEAPLWCPDLLGGVPLVGQATSRAFYPTAAVFALVRPEVAYAWLYLLHLVLGGALLDRLARRLGADEDGALLGTAAFVLSGYALGHLHHPMIFFAAVWTLPALEATHALLRPAPGEPEEGEGVRRRTRLPIAALAVATALSWLAGFPQASVLLGYLVAGLALVLSVEDRLAGRALPWRALLGVGLGLGLGLGLALVQVLPTVEAMQQSSREPAVLASSAARALAPAHLLELLLPGQLAPPGDLSPGGLDVQRPSFLALWLVSREKAGPLSQGVFNHMETAFAIGVWPLLFALATLPDLARGRRRATLLFLWGFTGLGLLVALAVPGPVHAALRLPGFAIGDFKRLLVLPAFCLPLLAALGWRRLGAGRLAWALLPASAALALGLSTLRADAESFARWFAERIAPRADVAPEAFLALLLPGEAALNQELLGRGLLALGLALAAVPLLALVPVLARGPWPFVLATAVELLPVAADLSPAPSAGALRHPPALLAQLAPGPAETTRPAGRLVRYEPVPAGETRAFADVRLLPPNLPLVLGLRDATGYAPLPPARVKRFFDLVEPGATSPGTGLGALRRAGSLDSPLLDLLGVTWLLSSEPVETPRWTPAGHRGATWLARRAPAPAPYHVFFETRRLAPEDLPAALAADLDPRSVAVLEPDAPPEADLAPSGPGTAEVEVLRAEPRAWELRVATDRACVLALAEAWAPGWRYRVDGEEVEDCFPVTALLRGTLVPAGEHTVEVLYAPRGFRLGWMGSLLALATLFGVCLVPARAKA